MSHLGTTVGGQALRLCALSATRVVLAPLSVCASVAIVLLLLLLLLFRLKIFLATFSDETDLR